MRPDVITFRHAPRRAGAPADRYAIRGRHHGGPSDAGLSFCRAGGAFPGQLPGALAQTLASWARHEDGELVDRRLQTLTPGTGLFGRLPAEPDGEGSLEPQLAIVGGGVQDAIHFLLGEQVEHGQFDQVRVPKRPCRCVPGGDAGSPGPWLARTVPPCAKVEFDITQGQKGPQAENVRVIG
jgi:hypothetical protein